MTCVPRTRLPRGNVAGDRRRAATARGLAPWGLDMSGTWGAYRSDDSLAPTKRGETSRSYPQSWRERCDGRASMAGADSHLNGHDHLFRPTNCANVKVESAIVLRSGLHRICSVQKSNNCVH